MDYDLEKMTNEFCEDCDENSMVETGKDNEWACRICGKVEEIIREKESECECQY